MPPKPIKITKSEPIVPDLKIIIKYAKDISNLTTFEKSVIYRIMNYFNGMIGAKTNINYHIERVNNFTITLPLYVYGNEESKMDSSELLSKRLKTVTSFFEEFDWKSVNKCNLWLVRSLKIMNIDIETCFSISVIKSKNNSTIVISEPTTLKISKPKLEYATIKRFNIEDHYEDDSTTKSHITYYIDPYLQDYGLFVDLSVPFNDMGMSYNALHLYEHLMTKCWSDCNAKDMTVLNGSTYPIGLSFIYTIHSSYKSLVHFLNKTLEFIIKCRDPAYWESTEMKEAIALETTRTISETRTERSLTAMGRSDFKAYDNKYDVNIFKYWSNLPFNILITSKEYPKIKINNLEELIAKHKLHHIQRPDNVVFDNIPIDVLSSKHKMGLYTKKVPTKDIMNLIVKHDFDENVLFGVDAGLYSINDDIGVFNSSLHPLLYLNKFFSDSELEDYVKTHVISNSSKLLSISSIQLKYECLIESDDE